MSGFILNIPDIRPEIDPVNREYLWPTEGDLYLNLVKYPIDPTTPQYGFDDQAIPKRKDLVAGGYADNGEDDYALPPGPKKKNDYSHLVKAVGEK